MDLSMNMQQGYTEWSGGMDMLREHASYCKDAA
jgi:hypothetical protein